jgi:hypothetical protein
MVKILTLLYFIGLVRTEPSTVCFTNVECDCTFDELILKCDENSKTFAARFHLYFSYRGEYYSFGISNKNFTHLNDFMFEKLTIYSLELRSNEIESISRNAFRGMKEIQDLRLENNRLKRIEQVI